MDHTVALTELLGLPVYDSTGTRAGRVREAAIVPAEDTQRVSALVVRTGKGEFLVPVKAVHGVNGEVRVSTPASDWTRYGGSEGMLLLGRDLLDQQIIDVNGRKVVRVNDVELHEEQQDDNVTLKVGAVDVGGRGAVRRLLKGLLPTTAMRRMLTKVPPKMIPWDFVDLIETDPARRVRLKIGMERLAKLHPADIADIIEELAPAEREAVFQTLDEEVAAETLEEIDPKLQTAIVNSLDADRAADIVEEMDPDAAADLLGELPEERSDEILEEMQPEQREEVEELLEYEVDTAAGRMTTDLLALNEKATVDDAVALLRSFEGDVENISTIFITDANDKLLAAVPITRLLLVPLNTKLMDLFSPPLISIDHSADEREVAELFDKYNLLTLPVVNTEGKLTGIITADDVISLLRAKI
jgi:sporulation protein YlmC with PRC-barrel domain/CBS domain-containing protein